MPHEFLSDFLSRLQDAGELVRIAAPVDPGLELAAITNRVAKAGDGPALLFENPRNSAIPIVTNLLGSSRRVCLALGMDSLEQLPEAMSRVMQPDSPSWLDALRLTTSVAGLNRFAPRVIKTAVCQQVVKLGRDVNLWELPVPRGWPDEKNPVIRAGLVITQSSDEGRCFEQFPLQYHSQQQLIPHWNRHHAAYGLWQRARQQRKQFPIAVALGGDPVALIATAGHVVEPEQALLLAGLLRGTGLDLVKSRTVSLDVPAAAEIVLEGYIDYSSELISGSVIAGPANDYQPCEPQPIIQVTAISHRANPILPASIPGTPLSESVWISKASERLSKAIIQSSQPSIVELAAPYAGGLANILFVQIRKEQPFQARQILNAVWATRMLGLNKLTVIVDSDVDVHCERDVWLAVSAHANMPRDFIFSEGPVSMDDQTTLHRGLGHKLGIDATRKWHGESVSAQATSPLTIPVDLVQRLDERWHEFGIELPR